MGSNPGSVYWMHVSKNAGYYIEEKKKKKKKPNGANQKKQTKNKQKTIKHYFLSVLKLGSFIEYFFIKMILHKPLYSFLSKILTMLLLKLQQKYFSKNPIYNKKLSQYLLFYSSDLYIT
jgi:hypothetical protein